MTKYEEFQMIMAEINMKKNNKSSNNLSSDDEIFNNLKSILGM